MAEIEIQYIVTDTRANKDDVDSLRAAMNDFRYWKQGDPNNDWLVMDVSEKSIQLSLSRPVTNTGNHAEVQEVGEQMRRDLEASFVAENRTRLIGRFVGFAIYSANEELAVE